MGLFGNSKPKETINDILLKRDFEITKTLHSGIALLGQPSVYMDSKNQNWAVSFGKKVEPKIYKYSDILNCEIYENGGSITKGRSGSALVGGALFGAAGAVIGASRKKNQVSICKSLSVLITVNDSDSPRISIPFIYADTKTDSFTYKTSISSAQSLVANFEYMMNQTSQESNSGQSVQPSAADEIKKYKDLLDCGAITQDEYSTKKAQLLDA